MYLYKCDSQFTVEAGCDMGTDNEKENIQLKYNIKGVNLCV